MKVLLDNEPQQFTTGTQLYWLIDDADGDYTLLQCVRGERWVEVRPVEYKQSGNALRLAFTPITFMEVR